MDANSQWIVCSIILYYTNMYLFIGDDSFTVLQLGRTTVITESVWRTVVHARVDMWVHDAGMGIEFRMGV